MAHTNQQHSGFALIDGHSMNLVSALGSNSSWTGITAYLTAGEVLALGNCVYLKAADSRAWKALATATTTMPAIALATCVTAGGTDYEFLLLGFMRYDTWSWTAGGLLYVSRATAGELTQTLPALTGEQVQVVGVAITSHIILWNPSYELVEIA
jgi:hypothetical protein